MTACTRMSRAHTARTLFSATRCGSAPPRARHTVNLSPVAAAARSASLSSSCQQRECTVGTWVGATVGRGGGGHHHHLHRQVRAHARTRALRWQRGPPPCRRANHFLNRPCNLTHPCNGSLPRSGACQRCCCCWCHPAMLTPRGASPPQERPLRVFGEGRRSADRGRRRPRRGGGRRREGGRRRRVVAVRGAGCCAGHARRGAGRGTARRTLTGRASVLLPRRATRLFAAALPPTVAPTVAPTGPVTSPQASCM